MGSSIAGRAPLDPDKLEFAIGREVVDEYGFAGEGPFDLEEVVRRIRPTMLIGTSGTPGTFTEEAIREMARHARIPVVMPLSNPTSNCEAIPEDVLRWTDGRAVIATGSPFAPLNAQGRLQLVGQANNVFIFPGVGLGAIVAHARLVTDEMFLVAARTLADQVEVERLAVGAIYPPVSSLRDVTREIAIRVARQARDAGVGRALDDANLARAVDAAMWFPDYQRYAPVS